MITALFLVACRKDAVSTPEAVPIVITPTSPAPGAFVPEGELHVVGSATGLTQVTVNGRPTLQAGASFDGTVDAERGVVPIEIEGEDSSGNHWRRRYSVIAGEFAEPEGLVDDAMVLRLNRPGLSAVGDLVSGLLVPADLLADLGTTDPVYNVYFDSIWPLDDTDVDIYLTDLSWSPMRVQTEPTQGNLHLDVRLPSFTVEMRTYGTIPLLTNTDGDRIVMTAEEVHLAADVALDVLAEGEVRAALQNPTVQMPGFDITWEYLWAGVDWVVDLFVDLQTLVEDALLGALEDLVPPLLSDVFESLNTRFELDLLGTPMALRLELTNIDADADGIELTADLAMNAPQQLERDDGGWLTSDRSASPEPSRSAPMSVAISDDFLNRALYEVWASNAIALTMSTEDGSLDPLVLSALGGTEGTITVTAGLPPVVVDRDGRFVAELGEVYVRIETPGGDQGDFLEASLGASANLDLRLDGMNLELSIGEPDLRIQVLDSDWGASDTTITNLLEEQLPIDVLVLLLGNVSFPLPEIPYLVIDHATAERDASGAHTDLEVFLE